MYDLPANTLAQFLANPLLEKYSFAHITCKDLAQEIKRYKQSNTSHPTPESDAILFYMCNHGFHLIKSKYKEFETLPPKEALIVKKHLEYTNDIAKRLFSYIVLISIEEARYLPQQSDAFFSYMKAQYSQEFEDYIQKDLKGHKDLLSFEKLGISAGVFLRAIRSVFDFGKWNGGFGGKPWGNIVGLSSSVVFGRESFEMMADYAFSLCHNNGSMFNKGHLYSYNTHFIYDVLDIQASGQIPSWVNENKSNPHVSKKVKEMHDLFSQVFPKEFTAPLDQKKVKSSGEIRRKKEEQHMKALKSSSAPWTQNTNTTNQPQAPKAKIDNILIDTFSGKKWI